MKKNIKYWLSEVNEYLSLIINYESNLTKDDTDKTFFYEVVDYYEDKTIDYFVLQLLKSNLIDQKIYDSIQNLSENFYKAEKEYLNIIPRNFWESQKYIACNIQNSMNFSKS